MIVQDAVIFSDCVQVGGFLYDTLFELAPNLQVPSPSPPPRPILDPTS